MWVPFRMTRSGTKRWKTTQVLRRPARRQLPKAWSPITRLRRTIRTDRPSPELAQWWAAVCVTAASGGALRPLRPDCRPTTNPILGDKAGCDKRIALDQRLHRLYVNCFAYQQRSRCTVIVVATVDEHGAFV